VTVVDFESALIALGALHSADNELLWLSALTDAIPPKGTAVTMIISARIPATRELLVRIEGDGILLFKGKPISIGTLLSDFRRSPVATFKGTIVLEPADDTAVRHASRLVAKLREEDVPRSAIELRPAPPIQTGPASKPRSPQG
jgi:hypothetical protein